MTVGLLRHSAIAIQTVVPEHGRHALHRMYQDNDVDGARRAEALLEFLQQEIPGSFVGVLANNSVTPPCCNAEGHYPCSFDDPYWTTYLFSRETYERYREQIIQEDVKWQESHGCKLAKKKGDK